MPKPADLLQLIRPKDWIKGIFIVMPAPFALASGDGRFDAWTFALGVAGFSLVSSAVYCYNDLHDVAADRLHPTKRNRPIASRRVTPAAAMATASVLLIAGLGLVGATHSRTAMLMTGLYAAANLFYTHYAKHVAPLDVFLLASFFMIRVTVGCALVDAAPSNWLLLCSSTLALFLVLAKRRADLVDGLGGEHRLSLEGYSVPFLDQAMSVTAGISLLTYALYSIETPVFVPGREFASLPFAAAGLLDYLRLVHVHSIGGSPVDAVTSEPSIIICSVGWALAVFWSLNF